LPYVENMKVYVNGTLLDSVDPATSTFEVNFGTQVNLNAGDNEIKVVYDISSDSHADGNELIVKLIGYDYDDSGTPTDTSDDIIRYLLEDPEYVASGDSVNAEDIYGTATGAKISTAGANLTATRSDGYSDGRTIVRGTEGVSLGKITVKATNDNVKITSIAIASTTDNTVNPSNVYDMKLYVNDSQIGNTRDWTSSGATFSSLNLQIPKDGTKIIELKGSFDNSTSPNEYFKAQFTFTAEDSNGKTVEGINTPSTVKFDITDSGTLTVAKSADTPNPAILVANTTNNSVAKFKLSSSDDVTKVTEIYMSNLKGSDADPRISEVRLLKGTTVLDTDVPVNGEVHFIIPTGSLNIEKDGNVTVDVQVSLNQISNSDETDKAIQFVITKVKANGSNGSELDAAHNNTINFAVSTPATTTLTATTTASTSTLTVSDATIPTGSIIKIDNEQMLVIATADGGTTLTVTRGINGTLAAPHNNASVIYKVAGIDSENEFRVRKTVPTVNLINLPSETLNGTDNTIFKFKVNAAGNEDVNIGLIKLSITKSSSSLTLSNWRLKVNGNLKTFASGEGFSPVAEGVKITFLTPEVVAAGSEKTFEVIADAQLVDGAYNYVDTRIGEADNYGNPGTTVGTSDFEWTDGYTKYFNSYRVRGLPTEAQHLSTNLH